MSLNNITAERQQPAKPSKPWKPSKPFNASDFLPGGNSYRRLLGEYAPEKIHKGKAMSLWLQEWEENWARVVGGDVSNSRMELGNDIMASIDSNDGPFAYEYSEAAIAHAKHLLIDALMRDVYSIIGSQWNAAIQTHGAPGSESPNSHSQPSDAHGKKSRANGKRRIRDRGPSPPSDDNGKRTKGDLETAAIRQKNRLFACPYYKNNPRKYCVNDESGRKYRSCAAAPGLNGINRVK